MSDEDTRFNVRNDSEAHGTPLGRENVAVWTPERARRALATARLWIGTRHVNRISILGVGVDCIQYVFAIYRAAGILPPADLGTYSTEKGLFERSDAMEKVMLECLHAASVPPDEPMFGDIILFQTGNRSAHCGFYAEGLVWHALANQCVMSSPWALWKRKAERLVRLFADGWAEDPKLTMRRYGR